MKKNSLVGSETVYKCSAKSTPNLSVNNVLHTVYRTCVSCINEFKSASCINSLLLV